MRNQNYNKNRQWSNKFDKLIIEELLLTTAKVFKIAPVYDDENCNTDFISEDKKIRIAARVRKSKYKVFQDFTVSQFEYLKIMSGFGDCILYCFANEEENALEEVNYINLNEFRKKQIEFLNLELKKAKLGERIESQMIVEKNQLLKILEILGNTRGSQPPKLVEINKDVDESRKCYLFYLKDYV